MKKIIYLPAFVLLSIALYSCGGASEKSHQASFFVKEQVGDKYFVLVRKYEDHYDAYLCNDTNNYEDGLLMTPKNPCETWASLGVDDLQGGNVSLFISLAEGIIFDDDYENENKRFVMTHEPPFNDVIYDMLFEENGVKIYTDEGKYITYSREDHEQMKKVYAKTFGNGEKDIKRIEKSVRFSKRD